MKKLMTIVLACVTTSLLAITSLASISSSTGAILKSPPPPSVVVNTQVSATDIIAFNERRDVTLLSDLQVDIINPGIYGMDSDLENAGGIIRAGSCIDSHFLDFDPGLIAINLTGTVRFDAPILGLIVLSQSLDDTDLIVGSPGVTYPSSGSEQARGLEFRPQDSVVFTATAPDKLEVDFTAGGATDQIRIITACCGCLTR